MTQKKVLLLENIDPIAAVQFENQGFDVKCISSTLDGQELIEAIEDVHILCIRSRTKVTREVLQHAKKLIAIGCFCIGTNQVNLVAAREMGVCVFNSPFSNSRSVAELVIAQIINLSRRLGDANMEMHVGRWNKTAVGRKEIRGKTLGIVGYGNIGSQLSVLAEAMGMNVVYYDIVPKLALGNAKAVSLNVLLNTSDFVSLHVPETPDTKDMFNADLFSQMKKGSMILNAARGSVVNLTDLLKFVEQDHIKGVYLDVFQHEPTSNDRPFYCDLQDYPNVILTPHIGGATEEAQHSIALEVSQKLIAYILVGGTQSSVNVPNIDSPLKSGTYRITNYHHNTPGVLKLINDILGNHNIETQILSTTESIGYLIVDVDEKGRENNDVLSRLGNLEHSIKTRILN